MEKCAPYMKVLFRVDYSVTQSRQWWSCEENLVFPISFLCHICNLPKLFLQEGILCSRSQFFDGMWSWQHLLFLKYLNWAFVSLLFCIVVFLCPLRISFCGINSVCHIEFSAALLELCFFLCILPTYIPTSPSRLFSYLCPLPPILLCF